jgi:hypothetical protein
MPSSFLHRYREGYFDSRNAGIRLGEAEPALRPRSEQLRDDHARKILATLAAGSLSFLSADFARR